MTSVPLHMFVQELAFQDRSSFDYDPTQGGAGQLSSFSRTYFVGKSARRDPRSDRTTDKNLGAGTRAALWVDPVISDAELRLLDTATSDIWKDIFDLVDAVGFSFLPQQTKEDLNQRLQDTSLIYVADTLRFETGTELVTVHRGSGVTTDIIIPRSARIQIIVPIPSDDDASGSGGNGPIAQEFATQEIWFWYHDDAFQESYPNSYVTEVMLPLVVGDLLNASLVDKNRNIFSSGVAIATRHQEQLDKVISDKDNSGTVVHRFSVKGPEGNDTMMPFILVYKGQPPDTEQVRQAIVDQLLGTGVGTREDWKERIPDLFVDGQIYLIPMWDKTVERPSGVIQTNAITFAQLINTVLSTLPEVDRDHATNTSTIFTATYDYIPVIAVPNPQNSVELDFQNEHMTFRPLRTTDPAFVRMNQFTKDFSIALSKALSVAAEKSVNQDFEIIQTNNGRFVPFTIGSIQYIVMTTETLKNRKKGDL